MNQFGTHIRIQILGESHGAGLGVTLDGVPAGMPLDEAAIQAALGRRRPGQSTLTTQRKESDTISWQTGHFRGHATGAPLHGWIQNEDPRSKDYDALAALPRPSHADYPNHVSSKGFHDIRGGGHNSGRLTAALVAAGEAMQPILDAFGVQAGAYVASIGEVQAPTAATVQDMAAALTSPVGALGNEKELTAEVEAARTAKDSIGGTIAFQLDGLPVGLGDPFFDSLESTAAHLLQSVPAVKGVEFGAGFAAAAMRGSEHNDPWTVTDGTITPGSNHAGGAAGGRSTGAPFKGRVAIKPSSSIFLPQGTVNLETGQPDTLEMKGRHDPCIAIRAVPVVRACMQILAADWLMGGVQNGLLEHPWK
ncbi:MAG: chorismate synthase [Thermoplasmatota archaeon]